MKKQYYKGLLMFALSLSVILPVKSLFAQEEQRYWLQGTLRERIENNDGSISYIMNVSDGSSNLMLLPVSRINVCHVTIHDSANARVSFPAFIRVNNLYFIGSINTRDSSGRVISVIGFSDRSPSSEQDVAHPNTTNQTSANEYINSGNRRYNSGEYNSAIADYNEAIRLNPDNSEAYNHRAITFISIGNFNQAIADATEAIRLNPINASAYNQRAAAYIGTGNFNQGIADLTEAIRLNPNFWEAYSNRGTAYNNIGNYDQGIVDLTEAIRLNPNSWQSYNNRGYAYNERGRSGDFNHALADLNRAIQLNPNHLSSYSSRGFTHMRLGNYAQARADLDRVLRENPNAHRASMYAEELRRMGY